MDLRNTMIVQNQYPDPPVANLERLYASIHWRALLSERVVGDILIDHPVVVLNLPQARAELTDPTPVKDKGWQQALQSIYPLKIDALRITRGDITYQDEGPFKPLRVYDPEFAASNIRNVHSERGVYPSPVACWSSSRVMSSVIDPEDRATAVLFGDGAGVVLIEVVEDESVGILNHVFQMDGEGEAALHIPAGGSVEPATVESVVKRRHYLVQDGRAVFKAAVVGMTDVTAEVLKRNEVAVGDLAWLVPHQANGRRIIEAVAKRLGLGLDRVVINLDRYGNTVGATIPIALSEWHEKGQFTYGDRLVLSAFGAGFTSGSVYLRWAIA
jgi:hypothetical protein